MKKEADKATRQNALVQAENFLMEVYKIQDEKYQSALRSAWMEDGDKREAAERKANSLRPSVPDADDIVEHAETLLKFING